MTILPSEEFLKILEERFSQNMHRHENLTWEAIHSRLKNNPKLLILEKMESTGGEPDVIGHNANSDEYIFADCSKESPINRRSLCYDKTALDTRKENKPSGSAIDMAESMGVSLLTEGEYRGLQCIEAFDQKTSSWILTPDNIRKLGGALFCDRRYDTVFTYHNGADSYYSARGWRGSLRI